LLDIYFRVRYDSLGSLESKSKVESPKWKVKTLKGRLEVK